MALFIGVDIYIETLAIRDKLFYIGEHIKWLGDPVFCHGGEGAPFVPVGCPAGLPVGFDCVLDFGDNVVDQGEDRDAGGVLKLGLGFVVVDA